MRKSGSRARRRSAPTSATSTCTRRSASPTAAAGRAWCRSPWPRPSRPIFPGRRDATPDSQRYANLNDTSRSARLEPYFPVLYTRKNGRVAHEMIFDLRPLKQASGIDELDVAKRLMDYGFHAPTVSFPVAGTIMVEPTESEAKDELDRFCDAMIAIRSEIQAVADGKADAKDNVLKNAPHTAGAIASDDWSHPYSREQAAFPLPFVRANKHWPSVGRIDNPYGDRNLMCSCPPVEEYAKAEV